MSKTVIAEAPLLSLPALHRLFAQAVHEHFTYFPAATRDSVIRDNSVWKLSLAWLHPRRVLLTARRDGRLIGYAIGAAPAKGSAQLYWLYVEPEFRGSNTGLSLLSRMIKLLGSKGARQISLSTHDHRRYYERQGFKFRKRTTIDGVPMDVLTFEVKG